MKALIEAPVIHVTEKTKGGDTWEIWRNKSGQWAASKGNYRLLDYRAAWKNGKWRLAAPGENTASCAINTFIDWVHHGLHYDRGGSDITEGVFEWGAKYVPKTTISWVYGEPMQGATEIVCDARTGEPRIVVEDFWGLPVSEAEENNKRTVVYILQIDLKAAWPKWAE